MGYIKIKTVLVIHYCFNLNISQQNTNFGPIQASVSDEAVIVIHNKYTTN